MTAAVPRTCPSSYSLTARSRSNATTRSSRLRAFAFGTIVTAGLIAVTALAPRPAQAQQGAVSVTRVINVRTGQATCDNTSTGGLSIVTDISCLSSTVTGGDGAAAASTTLMRTASASATLTGDGSYLEGDATGKATQTSALTVIGAPSVGDQLVFHFLTTQSTSGVNVGLDVTSFWRLSLQGGGTTPANYAEASQTGYGGNSLGPLYISNATETAGGFDLTLPFTVGPTFSYYYQAFAEANWVAQGTPPGGTVTGSISAMLAGIDDQSSSGTFISSASFDPATGLGTIGAGPVTTTPEPGTLALLGTGLAALVPIVRRRPV